METSFQLPLVILAVRLTSGDTPDYVELCLPCARVSVDKNPTVPFKGDPMMEQGFQKPKRVFKKRGFLKTLYSPLKGAHKGSLERTPLPFSLALAK